MDFKQATDVLGRTITQADIARAAGVSHHSIRQARMDRNHPAHRTPPKTWPEAVARLARNRSEELLRLAFALEGDVAATSPWDAATVPTVRLTPPVRPTEPPRPAVPIPPTTSPASEPEPSPTFTRRLLRRLMK